MWFSPIFLPLPPSDPLKVLEMSGLLYKGIPHLRVASNQCTSKFLFSSSLCSHGNGMYVTSDELTVMVGVPVECAAAELLHLLRQTGLMGHAFRLQKFFANTADFSKALSLHCSADDLDRHHDGNTALLRALEETARQCSSSETPWLLILAVGLPTLRRQAQKMLQMEESCSGRSNFASAEKNRCSGSFCNPGASPRGMVQDTSHAWLHTGRV